MVPHLNSIGSQNTNKSKAIKQVYINNKTN